ncbi:MAG TPA: tetratricopeptide repeat-containing protein [Solimonas sp.]|nr:tetratricopeptide repeat-containing protein [Solimonas sp.]
MGKREHLSTAGATTLALRDWLALHRRADAGARRLRIGACGHLLLSRSETHRVRRELIERVLPALVADGATRLSLFVGMAPGADMLFLETAAGWLRERGLPFEMTALLPVPVDRLINDWLLRAQDEQRRIVRRTRAALIADAEALLQRCTTIVPLYPDDIDAGSLSSRAFRQHQYRRLAAIVAQHADDVVAILRPLASPEPGGTAEIVAWRRDPASIPAQLRLHATHCAGERPIHIVDPSPSAAARAASAGPVGDDELSRVLRSAELARRAGNELACNDIVHRALNGGLRSRRLEYLHIQALANTGNVRMALDRYLGLDLDDDERDEDWLALRGRLEKDLALAGGSGKAPFARAASAYREAYRRHGGSYSAINAASMLMLAGRRADARRFARSALRQMRTPRDEIERFYAFATESEAALLLGDLRGCRRKLAAANRLLRDDVARRNRTRQQLRMLCVRLGHDPALIDALQLPPLVLLQPGKDAATRDAIILPPLLRRMVRDRALLHLALCTPFELRLCEQLVAHGARLYLTLPTAAGELARQWRGRAAGAPHRLQRVLDAAEGVATLRGFLAGETAWAAAEATRTNRGLAQLSAERLDLRLQYIDCAGGGALRCRRVDGAATRDAPGSTHGQRRRMVGLIFADFASFRRLRDPLFPRYYREIMRTLATLLDRHAPHVLVRKTWGDALHVVTDDAASAAHIVADIQHDIERRRLRDDGVLGDLELRIAAHYAPAYAGIDPVERKLSYYGSQLSFAARIEPVVPPSMIYVTEAFAARVTLEAPDAFALAYAGEVELAKQFGTYRLYSLRKRIKRDVV